MVDSEASTGFSWVAGLPLVDAAGRPLPIELAVHDEPAGGSSPFVTLTDACRYSRPLLARIAVGGACVRLLVLKMQRDRYPVPVGAAFPLRLTNVAIDDMWNRERENLNRVRCREVVELVELGPRATRTGPISFCRHTSQFFRPLCPQSLTPLSVCRDDALLAAAGLEKYTESTSRYLYGGASASRGEAPATFYTWSKTDGAQVREGSVVRRRHELYRDTAELFRREDLSEAVVKTLEAEFPCWTCVHRDECYGVGGAQGTPIPVEDRVWPLTYYDSEVLALEMLDLQYDELCDVLGGAHPSPTTNAMASAARQLTAAPAQRALMESPRFLFEYEGGKRLALEVLHLKLIAFEQLCRGVQAMHERGGGPHLGICPDNVMASVHPGGHGLPARWHFSVKLLDLGAQHRFVPRDLDPASTPGLLLPAPDAARTYRSPLVNLADFSRDVEMRLAAKAAEKVGDRRVQMAEGSTRDARLGAVRSGDVVRISPFGSLPGFGEVALSGVVDEAGAGNARLIVGLPSDGSAKLPMAFDANVTFFRRYQAECDLYGLGMMLCRALLVHDERDMFSVEEDVTQLLDRLRLALSGTAQPTESWITTTLVSQLDFAETFSSASVLYDADARRELERPIPEALWTDIVVFMFRLMSTLDGFGLCTGQSRDSAEMMRSVLADLGELRSRVAVALFGTEAQSRDIGAACRELLLDVHADMFNQPSGEGE